MFQAIGKFFSKEEPLSRIVYISKAQIPGSSDDVAAEVQKIVSRAQQYNSESRITGLLLFSGSHFAQVLEGPEGNIKTLFKAIEKDPRHEDSQVLVNHDVKNRAFSDWDMALTSVNQKDMADIITIFPAKATTKGKDKLIVGLMQSHLDYYSNTDH